MNKRSAILKAADQLFSRHGYGLTGVDALAKAAGVTKRTIYKQFGSKEGLFTAWLKVRDTATRTQLIAAVQSESEEPKGQILALFSVLSSLAAKPEFQGCPFSHALLEFGTLQSANAGQLIAHEHKSSLATWILERLKLAGVDDPTAMNEEILTLYEGVLMRLAITRKPNAALAARRLLAIRLGIDPSSAALYQGRQDSST